MHTDESVKVPPPPPATADVAPEPAGAQEAPPAKAAKTTSSKSKPSSSKTEPKPDAVPPEEPAASSNESQEPSAPHKVGCPADPERQETYQTVGRKPGELYQVTRCQDCAGQHTRLIRRGDPDGGERDHDE